VVFAFLIKRDCFQQGLFIRTCPLKHADSFSKQRDRKIIGFCLHILGHTQRNRNPFLKEKSAHAFASGKDVMICSGRLILSQYLDTGLKQSFTEISWDKLLSSCLQYRRKLGGCEKHRIPEICINTDR